MAFWTRNKLYGGNDTNESGNPDDSFAEGANIDSNKDDTSYLSKLKVSPATNSTGLTRGTWLKTILYQMMNSFVHKDEDIDQVTATSSTLRKYVAKDQLPEVLVGADDFTISSTQIDGANIATQNMFELVEDTTTTRKKYTLSFSTFGIKWLKARTWLASEIDTKITDITDLLNDRLEDIEGVSPVVPGERYNCTTTTNTAVDLLGTNWGTDIFLTTSISGLSYREGNRLRFKTSSIGWWEGIVKTYVGSSLTVTFDKSSNHFETNVLTFTTGLGSAVNQSPALYGGQGTTSNLYTAPFTDSENVLAPDLTLNSGIPSSSALGLDTFYLLPIRRATTTEGNYQNLAKVNSNGVMVPSKVQYLGNSIILSGFQEFFYIQIPRNGKFNINFFYENTLTVRRIGTVSPGVFFFEPFLSIYRPSTDTIVSRASPYWDSGSGLRYVNGILISTGSASGTPSLQNTLGYKWQYNGDYSLLKGDIVYLDYRITTTTGTSLKNFSLVISNMYFGISEMSDPYKILN